MLRKTILILALPLSLSLPSWGAEEIPVASLLYEGAAKPAGAKPSEAPAGVAASVAQGRDADAGDAENVDCFYQQHANHPSCVKLSNAQAPDGTRDLHRRARY